MSLVKAKKCYHCKVIEDLTNTKLVALQQEYDNLQHYLQTNLTTIYILYLESTTTRMPLLPGEEEFVLCSESLSNFLIPAKVVSISAKVSDKPFIPRVIPTALEVLLSETRIERSIPCLP
jgi:hypothetical protein